ncbi:uncharacterized protein ACIBXB_004771 [Morphnus guianensis]
MRKSRGGGPRTSQSQGTSEVWSRRTVAEVAVDDLGTTNGFRNRRRQREDKATPASPGTQNDLVRMVGRLGGFQTSTGQGTREQRGRTQLCPRWKKPVGATEGDGFLRREDVGQHGGGHGAREPPPRSRLVLTANPDSPPAPRTGPSSCGGGSSGPNPHLPGTPRIRALREVGVGGGSTRHGHGHGHAVLVPCIRYARTTLVVCRHRARAVYTPGTRHANAVSTPRTRHVQPIHVSCSCYVYNTHT